MQAQWLAPDSHATDHDLTPNLKENSVATARTRWRSAYLKVNAGQRFAKGSAKGGAVTPLSESEDEPYHTADEDGDAHGKVAGRPAPVPPVEGAGAADRDVADVGKLVEQVKI
jgi:hypothetical protein